MPIARNSVLGVRIQERVHAYLELYHEQRMDRYNLDSKLVEDVGIPSAHLDIVARDYSTHFKRLGVRLTAKEVREAETIDGVVVLILEKATPPVA